MTSRPAPDPTGATPPPFIPSAPSQELSQFEYALLTLMFGFQSWSEACMEAAGYRGLQALDILTLHAVNHRARARRQADICMVLNIDEPHRVAYALKKLVAAGLVGATLIGRQRHYETTSEGEAACLAYRRIREAHLVPQLSWVASREGALADATGLLSTMTALYAQSGRLATAASAGLPKSPPLRTKR
ncbi:MAG: winged helix DNA-binding protein [Rhodoferax sp.]|nr:winged helix DNA-binding protein [Rhodoferax sp.]